MTLAARPGQGRLDVRGARPGSLTLSQCGERPERLNDPRSVRHAAVLRRSEMDSRRVIRSPRRRVPARSAAHRGRLPLRS